MGKYNVEWVSINVKYPWPSKIGSPIQEDNDGEYQFFVRSSFTYCVNVWQFTVVYGSIVNPCRY